MWQRFFGRWMGRRRGRLAADDSGTFYPGALAAGREDRGRFDGDRDEILRLALDAWRSDPLARRIVGLTTQYVVGGGVTVRSADPSAHRFLNEWWNHRLNQVSMRLYEWCDELTRSGELFFLMTTDAAGMSYLRAVPAAEIREVRAAENDIQQEVAYVQRAAPGEAERVWAAYHEADDALDESGAFPPVMLHYATNRPVGAARGESDLAPLLRWLRRYADWLEDRARLNRFRNTFLWMIKARFSSEEERQARLNHLALSPPTPGSILVVDEGEEWSVLNPKLESHEAAADGLALKKMVAGGAGLPLHFLAEPEGSNRSTAEAAGGPTYRHFEQRQEFFLWMLGDLARVALRRRALVDRTVRADAPVQAQGADLSARDNAALGVAASTIANAMLDLRAAGMVDDAEVLRMVYRFAGEVADVDAILAAGRRAGPAPDLGRSHRRAMPKVEEI